jgi:hypothetical protein
MIVPFDIHTVTDSMKELFGRNTILHRSMKQHPKFKVYKTFEYKLYLMGEHKLELIFQINFTDNVPAENIAEAWPVFDRKFLQALFKHIRENGISV